MNNYKKIMSLFKPDKNGISEWITIEEIKRNGLSWSSLEISDTVKLLMLQSLIMNLKEKIIKKTEKF